MPNGSDTDLEIAITFNCLSFPGFPRIALGPSLSYANVVISITPPNSPSGGKVTVTGLTFNSPCSTSIGGISATCKYVSSTSLLVTVPAGQGVNLAVAVTTKGQLALSPASFSYPPSLSALQATVIDSTRASVLTVSGSNFDAPCSSAVVNVNSNNINASCVVVSVSVVALHIPVFSTYSARSCAVLVSATINTVPIQKTYIIDVNGTLLAPSSATSFPPASSLSSNTGLIIAVSFSAAALLIVCACSVVAKRHGWCCFRILAPSYSAPRPPAYTSAAQYSASAQPHAPAANTREREMASAPPSDTVERQWGDYVVAFDARQQGHMGGQVHGAAQMPPRRASSVAWPAQQPHAPAANSLEQDMASAPPSDTVERQWGGYMAAFDARQQEHIGGQAHDQPSMPPFDSATLEDIRFRQQNQSGAAEYVYDQPSAPLLGGDSNQAAE